MREHIPTSTTWCQCAFAQKIFLVHLSKNDTGSHPSNNPASRNQKPGTPKAAPANTPYTHGDQLPTPPPMQSAKKHELPPAPTLLRQPKQADGSGEQRDTSERTVPNDGALKRTTSDQFQRLQSDHFERIQQELMTKFETVMGPRQSLHPVRTAEAEAQEGLVSLPQSLQSKFKDVSASSLHSTKQLPPGPSASLKLQATGAAIGSDWDDWPDVDETGISFQTSDIDRLPESGASSFVIRRKPLSDVLSADDKFQTTNAKALPERPPQSLGLATTGGDATISSKVLSNAPLTNPGVQSVSFSPSESVTAAHNLSTYDPAHIHRHQAQIEPPARQSLEPPPRTSRVLEEATRQITTDSDAVPGSMFVRMFAEI
jgi:hypothetical protein